MEGHNGGRPANDKSELYKDIPHFRDLVHFYEYLNGYFEKGIGASHRTGWKAVLVELISRIHAKENNL